jgi:hypothetical protein
MKKRRRRNGSVIAKIISELSFECGLLTYKKRWLAANDDGGVEKVEDLIFTKERVEELSGRIANARKLAKTKSQRERLSKLTINCEALHDQLIESTQAFI